MAGIIPGAGKNGLPGVVMTMNSLDLSGSDVFKEMYGMQTDDLGKTWTEAAVIANLAPVMKLSKELTPCSCKRFLARMA
jgi:hypothetical protein